MIKIRLHSGTRKARRYLQRQGFQVARCALLPQRFSRESDYRSPTGRTSACVVVQDTPAQWRKLRRLWEDARSPIFDFR